MKVIRAIICASILLSATAGNFMPAHSQAPSSRTEIGLRTGFTTHSTTALAGIYLKYRFSNRFTLSPSVDYMFRHKGVDGIMLNLDAQTPFSITTDSRLKLYPIAGISYSSYSHRTPSTDNANDSSHRISRLGINIGSGLSYAISGALRIGFEVKANITKQESGAWLTGSIGYAF